ncbi:predicted protein [Histoplasma capsulatum G186AR]|uniref:Uncharacterized protein n=2 Tax=Ajellomyces capsulatus TaxID=5037 RepID=C0NAT4_AJECG|nr:uncharacterized protein HCBG_00230 [Histoplasma capsulatum G186AR]EEH10775.1 predicted protein [Histoplasma capsulatum G186AR]
MTAERLSSVGFRPYDVRQIWDIFYGTSPLPQANDGVQQHRLANTMILRHAAVNHDFSVLLVTYLVGGKGLNVFAFVVDVITWRIGVQLRVFYNFIFVCNDRHPWAFDSRGVISVLHEPISWLT